MALDKFRNTIIFKKGRRSGSSGVIRLTDKEIGPNVKFVLSQDPGIYLYISNSNKNVSIELMKNSETKDTIEKEIGFNLTWTLSDKRAQYVSFHYDDDLTKNDVFSAKEWPRPLNSWNSSSSPTAVVPLNEDLEIMTKFFETFAPMFEKVMRKHLLEILKS